MLPPNSHRLKKNNFDLLRLLFAGTVCLAHCNELSGYPELRTIVRFLSSEVAVKAFFVVSGFLIFMSFERSISFTSYTNKRIRRIYPAYFTVVMICAIGLALASSINISNYFSLLWIKYVAANLSFLNFLQPTLPGVFEANKMAAVNGALWTLKIEVMFYLTVPLFVFLFRKFGHLPTLVFIYCLSVAYSVLCTQIAEHTGSGIYVVLGRQLPGQLSYFMSGAFFYYYLQLFERKSGYFIFIAMLVLVLNYTYSLPPLEPFALASMVIFFGLFFYVGNFGKYGDFSYGVYILHFPIIQLLLYAGWFREKPWIFLIAVISLTAISAIAMWHLVEKRFLLRGSHYVAVTSSFAKATLNQGAGSDEQLSVL